MKQKKLLWLLPLIPILLLALLIGLWTAEAYSYTNFETRDIGQYGTYVGRSEEYMQAYIGRFFPEKIEDYFQDVSYVFKSGAVDTYSFEAMLEFTIEDEAQFRSFVEEATDGLYARTFHYDPSFEEYVVFDLDDGFVHDAIMLTRVQCRDHQGKSRMDTNCYAQPHEGQYYRIDSAKIAKILVDRQEQRIIYVAFAVHDGGGSATYFFNEYFNRFGLNPKEYEAYTEQIARLDSSLVTKAAFVTVSPDGTVTEEAVLPPEQYKAFFEDFARMKYYINWEEPVGKVTGQAILLTFRDGTEYLCNHECTIRTINGHRIDTWEYFDLEVFAEFWNRYCGFSYEG